MPFPVSPGLLISVLILLHVRLLVFFYLCSYVFLLRRFFSLFKSLIYSSNGIGEVEGIDDGSKINSISASENDAVPNFSAIADFSPESAKSSPLGILLSQLITLFLF